MNGGKVTEKTGPAFVPQSRDYGKARPAAEPQAGVRA